MRQLSLHPHPETPAAAPSVLRVGIAPMRSRVLRLDYRCDGGARHVALPAGQTAGERTDGLWRHTCFELFVRPGAGEAYCECNFSPRGAWAAYSFTGYRAGMAELAPLPPPAIALELGTRPASQGDDPATGHLGLRVEIDLSAIAMLPVDVPWHVGLSAVIEDRDGAKSYWALAHPQGAPDFHDPACFAFELPAAR